VALDPQDRIEDGYASGRGPWSASAIRCPDFLPPDGAASQSGKKATGFKIALEIAAKGGDSLRVTEIPVTFIDRERGTSKFGTSRSLPA